MAPELGFPRNGEPNQGWKLSLASLIMVLLATIFVLARTGTRVKYQQFGADDWTVIASLIISILLSVAIQLAIANGYGMHRADLGDYQYHKAMTWFFVAQIPYKAVVCLNKISALLLYKRLFVFSAFQRWCWCIVAIVICWTIGAVFATLLQCIPIQRSWDRSIDGHCINRDAFWIIYAIGNILTDVLVLTLPVREVLKMRLKPRDKVMVCGVFLLGGIVTLASILRTTAVSRSLHNKEDPTYKFIPRGVWTLIEANLGIICACLPILKQPLVRLMPRLLGSNAKYNRRVVPARSVSVPYLNTVSQPHDSVWAGSNTQPAILVSVVEAHSGVASENSIVVDKPFDNTSFLDLAIKKSTSVTVEEGKRDKV